MSAERYLSAFNFNFAMTLNTKPLQGHFRSKLFASSTTTNPLLAAAEPLLSLMERLNIAQELPNLDEMHANIEHELQAFRSRLASQCYAEELTAIAHYLLTATIDELLGKNYLRIYGSTAEFKAFTPVSVDESGPESYVFHIIRALKERTNQSLNVLELAYFCLITGFEGEYHVRADGRQALENLIEELHQLIRQHRVIKPYRPFKDIPIVNKQPTCYKILSIISISALCIIGSIYFSANTFLTHKTITVLQLLHETA